MRNQDKNGRGSIDALEESGADLDVQGGEGALFGDPIKPLAVRINALDGKNARLKGNPAFLKRGVRRWWSLNKDTDMRWLQLSLDWLQKVIGLLIGLQKEFHSFDHVYDDICVRGGSWSPGTIERTCKK